MSTYLPTTFARVQGGARTQVVCVGRLGTKQILVNYYTKSGTARRRWLPIDRVEITAEQVAQLRAYHRVVCPKVKFVLRVAAAPGVYDAESKCPKCGKRHRLTRDYERVAAHTVHLYFTGRKQLLLGIVPVEVTK